MTNFIKLILSVWFIILSIALKGQEIIPFSVDEIEKEAQND